MVVYGPELFVGEYLRAYTKPTDRVLDVGCGPSLYRDFSRGRYIGLDVTVEPYGEGVARDVDVIASAQQLPHPDGVFDLVISKSAFFQFPDPSSALAEMKRVLKPGGRLILFDYNRRTQRDLEKKEDTMKPKWTQWGLRRLVRRYGFKECRLLLPTTRQMSGIERCFRLVNQELRGSWAIVTGIK